MENSGEPPASGELASGLGAVLERLVALIRSLNTAHPISRTSSGTLATLERDGACRLTALAAREGVTQPAMTQLIGRLEDAGLVRRDADPSDGRVVRVSITDAGKAVMATRRAERAERLGALLARLSTEHRQLLAAALPALGVLADTREDAPVPAQNGAHVA
ncbi:MAG TPA: MarR family transcriptional regulator [Trebonia sp.]|jgi:DNA-binding MarR family transcriptional regulator|nr:MarR family transcriptional regulator [Trebonia sp.]